jgi:uncharacterized protein
MKNLIGRIEEKKAFEKIKNSNKPEFVAVFGRRRVGKTFLIKQVFNDEFAFKMTGIANTNTERQLTNFFTSYNSFALAPLENIPSDWFEAFNYLIQLIKENKEKTCVVFIDEMPWIDTKGSEFIQAIEHFWNNFGSNHSKLKLIVCGSAASWMINKLINNKGGLHNRVTKRINVLPFTLNETEQFFLNKNIKLDRYQIVQIYTVMGGIPFYLEEIESGLSAFQNIDKICFNKNGLLQNEYQNLFGSLFNKPKKHLLIIEMLAQKSKGMTRDELIIMSKLPNGGTTTKVIEELEMSGFIKKYMPFGRLNKNSLYQLVDPYSLFYNKFIKDRKTYGDGSWINLMDSSLYRAWSGYAFEYVCMNHIEQIKKALGISGIYSEISSWRSLNNENGAQIDLLIDRKDNTITICEIKFSIDEFEITKSYAESLKNKISVFRKESKTKKSIFMAMITTFGVKSNEYAISLVQNSLLMEDLF